LAARSWTLAQTKAKLLDLAQTAGPHVCRGQRFMRITA
jgi:hypothetical protein